jgi:hypothetical protein
MKRWIAAIALAVMGAPTTARADERWYGWQTMATDGGAYLMLVGGGYGENSEAMIAGVGLYVLGAPLVHTYHEEYARAGISVGLRAGLPVLGGLLGGKVFCSERSKRREFLQCFGEFFIGAAVGVVAAQVTDAALLAYTDEPTSTQPRMISFGARF